MTDRQRTPDEHLTVLRDMLADHEHMATSIFVRKGRFYTLHRDRAAALRWILDQNAYGVEPNEVVDGAA